MDEDIISAIETTEADKPEEKEEICLATVSAVSADGVTVTVDGDTTAGTKKYRVNSSALFKADDRVKIHKNSGTFIIEYPIGNPMESYPIPSGGSDGQVLTKDGATSYAVKWAAPAIPAGGSNGQVLTKDGATDYAVKWATVYGIPSGGTSGQALTKTSGSNYAVQWSTIHEIPTGGSSGQVLAKSSATDYAVSWSTILQVPSGGTTGHVLTKNASGYGWAAIPSQTVSSIANGTYNVSLNASGQLVPSSSGGVSLGNSTYYFGNLYQNGDAYIAYNTTQKSIYLGRSNSKLGFFGTTPIAKKTNITTSTSLANLIQALKDYGLF